MIHSLTSSRSESINGEFSRTPTYLASCFGWLETLDYFKMDRSPEDFHDPALGMMTAAIRCGQTSVVRWLYDHKLCPTNDHIKLAFQHRRPKIVQFFLDVNTLSHDRWIDGQEVLLLAVRFDFVDIYRSLLEKGANIKCLGQDGGTLLHVATSTVSDNGKIVKDLLSTGMDPIAEDYAAQTPLSLSIILFKTQILAAGLRGENGVLQSSSFYTACLLLHYGLDSMLRSLDMRTKWSDILELLATSNASIWVTKPFEELANDHEDHAQLTGQTLLGLAALLRHERAFQVLLDRGIDPTCPAICGALKQSSTVVQMGQSISRQVYLDQKLLSYEKMSDELRQGPLAWAAYTGNISLVQSILDGGLNPNIKNMKGQTGLYFAVRQTKDKHCRINLKKDKEVIVRLLLQKGASVTSADACGGAALLAHAFKAGNIEVAKLLLENGAEIPKAIIDGPDACGGAALLAHAFKAGNIEVVKLLLENGAKIPKAVIDGPVGQALGILDQGPEGIHRALLKKIQGTQVDLSEPQWSSADHRCAGDPLGLAARLVLRGTMRLLGDSILTTSRQIKEP